MNKWHQWPACVAVLLFVAMPSCSPAEQAQFQTQIAQVGQTAVVVAQTEAPPFQTELAQAAQTAAAEAVKIAETQAANLKQTAEAQLSTELAKQPPPSAITDLIASPGETAGQVVLSWTSPTNGSGGPVVEYDVRHYNTPINNNNWTEAEHVQNAPGPSLSTVTWTMPLTFTLGTRRYFAIKAKDILGNWSDLSNVVSIQDLGFRPDTAGYNFCNGPTDQSCGLGWNSSNPADFLTVDDLRGMLWDEAVCISINGPQCEIAPGAKAFLDEVNSKMGDGHCLGMTITSLRFFTGADKPSIFQTGTSATHELSLSNARHNIAYYQSLQHFEPIVTLTDEAALQQTPQDILRQAISISDPTFILIGNSAHTTAHSVTPYTLEERGDGIWRIWVYPFVPG